MADRFPLIFNTSSNQIQELSASDNLDLSSSGLVKATSIGATHVSVSGVVTATDFNSTSDINLKGNIHQIKDPLERIIKINGVGFKWKETQENSMGVIAQDVEEVFPELVKSSDGKKTVNYNGLVGALIEAVKEQNILIKELTEKVNNLEDRLS
jgi:hypothetical protein